METAVEVPTFKLAKVGKSRERKRGALPLWFGGGSAGAPGFTGALALTGTKTAVAMLAAALGVAAYGLGKNLAPPQPLAAQQKAKLFQSSQAKQEADLSNLPSTRQQAPSSLSMVTGSLDGKTPEERAAEQAAAEASAKAEAEKQAKAAATPAEQAVPGASGVAGVPGMDAAALAAAAAGAQGADKDKQSGPFSNRYGALTSGLGSGHSSLAGGTGLSGGVGRAFEMPKLGGNLGRTSAFGQGSKPGRAAARPTVIGQSGRRGFARNQLDKAFMLSQAARHGTAEGRSSNASAAFENNPGANSAITGAGSGAGRVVSNLPDSAPSSNPTGGGASSTPGEATSNTSPDECSNGQVNSSAGGCVNVAGSKNVTPWQPYVKIATVLMGLAFLILLVAGIWALADPVGFYGKSIAQWLGGIAAALGFIVTMMGIMILAMGQTTQGTIFTVTGALVTAAGLIVALMPEAAATTPGNAEISGWQVAASIVGPIAAGAGFGTGVAHWD